MGILKKEEYEYNLNLTTFDTTMSELNNQIEQSENIKNALNNSLTEGVCVEVEGQTIDPLTDNVEEMTTNLDNYITSLNFLKAKIDEYKVNMADTYSIKDVNRAIYLDVLGLDEWLKALKEYFGIDSEEINSVIDNSAEFDSFVSATESEIASKTQEYSDGFISDWIQGDSAIESEFRQEADRYDKAKSIYTKSNDIVRKLVKFDEELDVIIKNIASAKGINDIEDMFNVDAIKNSLSLIKEGNYQGVTVDDVKGYSIESPYDFIKTVNTEIRDNPRYGTIPLLEDLPQELQDFIKENGLDINDFLITDDGFLTYTKPIDELGLLSDDFYSILDNGELSSDWYIYGVLDSDGNYTYSLYRLKQDQFACSFIEMNLNEDGKLTEEEFYKIVQTTGDRDYNDEPNNDLTDYFEDVNSKGSFVISDLQVMYMAGMEKYGDLESLTAEEYNEIIESATADTSSYAFVQEMIYHAENAHKLGPVGEAGEVMNAGHGEEGSGEDKLNTDNSYHDPDSEEIDILENTHNPNGKI